MAFNYKTALILFLSIIGTIYCQTTTDSTTTTTTATTTTTTTVTTTTVTTTQAATTSTFPTVPATKNLGACICDLTKDLCDLNCCCDSSCSSADISSFTVCIDDEIAKQIYNARLCVPQSQIFTTNTPYIIESFQDLLCLSLDNYDSLNYYQQPPYLTLSQISSLTSLVVPSKSTQAQSGLYYKYSTSTYKANDPLWIISTQDVIGYLAMPNDFNGNCEVNSPSTYLDTKTTTCTYTNLIGKCNPNQLFLNYNYFNFYITNSKLLKNANSIVNCVKENNITDTTTNLYQKCTNYLVSFNKPSCVLADGTKLTDCSANLNTLVADTTNCLNLVKTVTYKFKYLNPNGIVSADVNIEFTTVPLANSFQQTFKVVFESQNAAASNNSYKRSGNPGYLVGAPLVAGNLISNQIILNDDSSTWFTIPKQDVNGKCSNSASRSSIKFGINAATDCIFEQSITNIDCIKLQNDIYDIIRGISGNRPTNVATFGNSDTENPGAWISIVYNPTNTPKPDTTYKDTCDELITSATINIAYANAGDITNPQAMILYVGYELGKPEKISYQCFGQSCTNNLKVRITTKVIFIDISKPPEHIEAKIATPQIKLPSNFFYPFVLTTNNSNTLNKNMTLINILAFVLISFLIKKLNN